VIAAKMIGEAFDYELLSPLQSLFAVVSILAVGVAASLQKKDEEEDKE
jgi:predicted tellurium resistance membrane protein TerC